ETPKKIVCVLLESGLGTRLPVVIRFFFIALIVGAGGTIPWAMLVPENPKLWSPFPWAVIPAALYLWFFWRFVRGEGWPRSSAEARRMRCRANPLSGEVFGIALTAGVLGLATVILFQHVMIRLVTIPQQREPAIAHFPLIIQLLLSL